MSTTRTQKVLVPLATLLVAGAIAVGSGATFTSSTGNTISSVASGSLSQKNSKDKAAIFNLTNLKPGDTVNGSLTITNTGSLPATFSLTEASSTNTFSDKPDGTSFLRLVVTNVTTGAEVYSGSFGGLVDGAKTSLTDIAPAASNDFRFSVTLDADAPNGDQGKTASATYNWDSVQLAGQTTAQ